jgi:glutamine cyclotransferase
LSATTISDTISPEPPLTRRFFYDSNFREAVSVISLKLTAVNRIVLLISVGLALWLSGCGPASQGTNPSPAIITTSQPATIVDAATNVAVATSVPAPVSPVSSPVTTPPPSPTSLSGANTPTTTFYTFKIIAVYPHDRNSFTQGLVYREGELYEGSGLYGRSSLRQVDLQTGEVRQILELPLQFFGEGITIWDDQIIQLTWKANTGFVYDQETFELRHQFTYPTEGWGITYDGEKLIMSDGTATLYFWDPETLAEIGRVEVRDANGPVVRLNELEYINGEVYANVWQTNHIVRIDPTTGWVSGSIDLTGLLTAEDLTEPVDVLNGIAYDADNDRLFVTGKLWPKLFEIELVEVK